MTTGKITTIEFGLVYAYREAGKYINSYKSDIFKRASFTDEEKYIFQHEIRKRVDLHNERREDQKLKPIYGSFHERILAAYRIEKRANQILHNRGFRAILHIIPSGGLGQVGHKEFNINNCYGYIHSIDPGGWAVRHLYIISSTEVDHSLIRALTMSDDEIKIKEGDCNWRILKGNSIMDSPKKNHQTMQAIVSEYKEIVKNYTKFVTEFRYGHR
jgi:hypothetical protein